MDMTPSSFFLASSLAGGGAVRIWPELGSGNRKGSALVVRAFAGGAARWLLPCVPLVAAAWLAAGVVWPAHACGAGGSWQRQGGWPGAGDVCLSTVQELEVGRRALGCVMGRCSATVLAMMARRCCNDGVTLTD